MPTQLWATVLQTASVLLQSTNSKVGKQDSKPSPFNPKFFQSHITTAS